MIPLPKVFSPIRRARPFSCPCARTGEGEIEGRDEDRERYVQIVWVMGLRYWRAPMPRETVGDEVYKYGGNALFQGIYIPTTVG